MLRNHLKIAYRNLLKHTSTSSVNVLGLALGMAVSLLIAVYIWHEFSFDHWIPESENTYRVFRSWDGDQSGTVWSPSRLAGKLRDDFPEVISATGLSPQRDVLLNYQNNKLYIKQVAGVDSTFFETVQIPLVAGNPTTVLQQPKSLIISQQLADRVFKDENPLGKTVEIDGEESYQITGIFDLADQNTHLDYDAYMPITWYSDSWTGNNRATYLRLRPDANITQLENKITETITKLILQEYESINYSPRPEELAHWSLQPINDIYLHSANIGWISGREGDIRYVRIFLMVAFLILCIAIINYVNLATAQSTGRAQEVGVRKVSGAGKRQLVSQFLTESIIQALFAGLIALGLAELLMPVFERLVDRDLPSLVQQYPVVYAFGTLGLALLVGATAGGYPAFVLSSFKPGRAFRAHRMDRVEKGTLRKVLVSVQFAITMILLISMAFINRQVNYMLDYDLGFSSEQVVSITMNSQESAGKVNSLREQFLTIPGVKNLSVASRLPGGFVPDWGMTQEGRDEMLNPNVIFSDPHFLNTLEIPLVEGRFLSDDFAADTVNNFVVNEAFVQEYQIEDPVGTRIKFSSEEVFGRIVGVCQNFHFADVSRKVRPLVIGGQDNRWYTAIRVETKKLESTLADIKDIWSNIEPKHPIRMGFLDASFQQQYEEHRRLGRSMLAATILTLFIALLGLFGLTDFLVRKKVKEIGIRKVLGASTMGIIFLFIREFLIILTISFVIALPLSLYTTQTWLQEFAHRISIDPWTFIISFAIIILITVLTVALRSFYAAQVNPVESLRSE